MSALAARATAPCFGHWLACAVAVGPGAWAQESLGEVVVDSKDFVAYRHDEQVVLLPARWPVRLVRDDGVDGPSCDFLYDQLRARAPRIAACREGRASPEHCDRLRRLISRLRTFETDLGRPRLVQGWQIDVEPMVVDSGVRHAVARELNIELATLLTPSSIELTGPPRGVTTTTRFDERSWSGLVVGLVNFDEPPVRYSDVAGPIVTQDHLVACGLLDGVVQLRWTQSAQVTFVGDSPSRPPQGPSLDEAYRYLGAVPPPGPAPGTPPVDGLLWRAVWLGVAMASALAFHDVSPPFESHGPWLTDTVAGLFDEELSLLPGLTSAESTRSPPVVLEMETTWLASAAQSAEGGYHDASRRH
jgi:hypothetical protein